MKVILWTKAVGSPNYVKSGGVELEDVIIAVHAPSSSSTEYESAEEFAERIEHECRLTYGIIPFKDCKEFANRYAAERRVK